MEAVGVWVGEEVLHLVRMRRERRGCSLVGQEVVAVPPGAVVQGEVRAVGDLAQLLQGRLRRHDRVVMALDARAVLVRLVVLPVASHEEAERALLLNWQRYLPVPKEELVYQVFSQSGRERHQREVVVVGCRRETSYAIRDLFRSAGVSLAALDIQPLCLWRAFHWLGAAPQRTFLAVDLAQNPRSLIVYREASVPVLSRVIPAGVDPRPEVERAIRFFMLQSRQENLEEAVVVPPDEGDGSEAVEVEEALAEAGLGVVRLDPAALPLRPSLLTAYGAALRGCGR